MTQEMHNVCILPTGNKTQIRLLSKIMIIHKFVRASLNDDVMDCVLLFRHTFSAVNLLG